jgi:hypothetical protein
MGLERRTFLQQAGSALLALGAAPTGLSWLGADRACQALAASTARKLALLVGVDRYAGGLELKGCLTDVERQRELLIHRFGFHPADILTLTGSQATREAIETAFLEHLIEQAASTDVVVFHFSGYGTPVKIPLAIAELFASDSSQPADRWVNSLVPSDGLLSVKETTIGNALLEETLWLLARSLATDKLTLVLDTSYSRTDSLLQGNCRPRTLPEPLARLNPEELAFQQQLQSRKRRSTKLPFSGLALSAAGKGQVALEITGRDFSAGLFTYALTQYLWQVMPPSRILVTLSRTAEQLAPLVGSQNQPQLSSDRKPSLYTYYLLPASPAGAEGIITSVEDSSYATVQLTGLPLRLLDVYGLNACLQVASSASPTTVLQLRSRQGQVAKTKLLAESASYLQVGQLVQELIRILPRQLHLTVALAPQMERIERVDATSAFASVPEVAAVVAAGEQAADCVLGRVSATSATSEPAVGGYGLFAVGGVLLPHTAGMANEAVKSAVGRLAPRFNRLLASKLWGLTANEGSSQVGFSATLELVAPTTYPLIRRETQRHPPLAKPAIAAATDRPSLNSATGALPYLVSGSRIQYRLENYSDRPLYCLLVGTDANGQAIALYPFQLETAEEGQPSLGDRPILSGESLILPHPSASVPWLISGETGLVEVQVIAACAPFKKTLEALATLEEFKPDKEQLLSLHQPLAIATAILEDLHQASAVSPELGGDATDSYALDVRAWASLSFVYQVVEQVAL